MATCPVCGKDDTVQKVSAIVDMGSFSGTVAGPSATVTHTKQGWEYGSSYFVGSTQSRTQLANKLAPPSKPSRPGLGCTFYIGLFLFLFFGLPMLIYSFYGFVPSAGIDFFGLFLGVAGALIMGVRIAKKKQEEEQYSQDQNQWQKDIREWEQRYYCARDDVMFNPNTGDSWSFTRAA